MRIRLTKKFANLINGFDLTQARVGSVLAVCDRDGEMLIAEGWAVPHFRTRKAYTLRAEAADAEHRRRVRPRNRDSSD